MTQGDRTRSFRRPGTLLGGVFRGLSSNLCAQRSPCGGKFACSVPSAIPLSYDPCRLFHEPLLRYVHRSGRLGLRLSLIAARRSCGDRLDQAGRRPNRSKCASPVVGMQYGPSCASPE